MTTDRKVVRDTTACFEMAGTLLCKAAAQAGLSPELNASLVEHYTGRPYSPLGLFANSNTAVAGLRLFLPVARGHLLFPITSNPSPFDKLGQQLLKS